MNSQFLFLHRDRAELRTDLKPGTKYALTKSGCDSGMANSASAIERGAEMREPSDRSMVRRTLGLGVLASLFAVFSRGLAHAADALTISPNGEVGIDKLSVQSRLAVAGPATIAAKNTLEFGAGVAGKEVSAGKIGYQSFTTGALDIVGAGNSANERKLKFWAEGGATLDGDLTVSGTVVAGKGALPVGAILMWSGDPAKLPAGWKLCDGTNGTPNLLGRFVVGYNHAQSDYNQVNNKGGEERHKLLPSEIPDHVHPLGQRVEYIAHHTHRWASAETTGVVQGMNGLYAGVQSPNTGNIAAIRDAAPHENRPPYYVLAYIMYTG
jgi:microcystin-dependent protein